MAEEIPTSRGGQKRYPPAIRAVIESENVAMLW
jgi:hypothetical protein